MVYLTSEPRDRAERLSTPSSLPVPTNPQNPNWIEKTIDPDDIRRNSVSEGFFKNTNLESAFGQTR